MDDPVPFTHGADAVRPAHAGDAGHSQDDGGEVGLATSLVQLSQTRVQVPAYGAELQLRVAPLQLGGTTERRGACEESGQAGLQGCTSTGS